MFDLGIVKVTSNANAELRCGCHVQNYRRVTMWLGCSEEHELILTLGWERVQIEEAIEKLRRVFAGAA